MLTDRRDAPMAPGSTAGKPTAAGASTGSGRVPGGARRVALHAAALAAALLAIVLVVDNGDSAITDEGAVVAQVGAVAGGSWAIELPLPAVDPDGAFVTMENSAVVDGAYLPYAKHPAYPVLLVPFWELAGHTGLLVASALGTWAAAVIAMFLCRRMLAGPARSPRSDHRTQQDPECPAAGGRRPAGGRRTEDRRTEDRRTEDRRTEDRRTEDRRTEDLGLVTMWLLGLGSPMLFGATTVMAHSIGAALTAGVVLALVAGLDDGIAASRRVPLVALAVLLAVPLVLLRSEGLFAVAGIAAALGVCSVRSVRPPRIAVARAVTAVVVASVGAASYLLDGRLAASIQRDEGVSTFVIGAQQVGFVEGRLLALWASILRPGDPRLGPPAIVLFVAISCLVGGAILLRRSPRHAALAAQLVVVGAVLTVVRQFLPVGQVTGLVAAFPVLAMGLIQLRRSDLASLTARICVVASVVAASLVLATSYSIGGAAEWGGRFYHLLLPLLVPLAVLGGASALAALRDAGQPSRGETDDAAGTGGLPATRRPATARVGTARVGTAQVVAVAVLVATVSLSVLCLRSGIDMRRDTEAVVEQLLEVTTSSATPNDGGAPIVVTDARGLGRVSWGHLDDVRILRMPEAGQLGGLLDQLAAAEVGAVVLAVHPDEDIGTPVLGEWQIAHDDLAPGRAWRHVELVQHDPPGE